MGNLRWLKSFHHEMIWLELNLLLPCHLTSYAKAKGTIVMACNALL